MTGDRVDFGARYFYQDKNDPVDKGNILEDILSSLAGGIVNASGVVKGTLADLSNSTTSPLLGALNTFRSGNNPDLPGKPKAYLNWIMLDEQFNYVSSQSGAKPVERPGEVLPLMQPEIAMEKNGYLYIYVSNETENWDVYFDDLKITHRPGALLEETHYYPFGLTMAGISSKALGFGAPENKHKFNGIEQNNDFNLNMYDAFYRNFDPQVGRWWQTDPKPNHMESLYAAMGNNPIRFNDFLGDTTGYYNEQGQKIYNDNNTKTNNNYVIRTTKSNIDRNRMPDDAPSNPISKTEAEMTESYIKESSLWDEAVPVNIKPVKANLVEIKSDNQMAQATDVVSQDDGTGGMKPGNNREYSGKFTKTGIVQNAPGTVINLSNPAITKASTSAPSEFHSHPSGTLTIAGTTSFRA